MTKKINQYRIILEGVRREEARAEYVIDANNIDEAQDKAVAKFEEDSWEDWDDVDVIRCDFLREMEIHPAPCSQTIDLFGDKNEKTHA